MTNAKVLPLPVTCETGNRVSPPSAPETNQEKQQAQPRKSTHRFCRNIFVIHEERNGGRLKKKKNITWTVELATAEVNFTEAKSPQETSTLSLTITQAEPVTGSQGLLQNPVTAPTCAIGAATEPTDTAQRGRRSPSPDQHGLAQALLTPPAPSLPRPCLRAGAPAPHSPGQPRAWGRRGASPHLHRGHAGEAELPQRLQHARTQRHGQRLPAPLSHRLHLGWASPPTPRGPASAGPPGNRLRSTLVPRPLPPASPCGVFASSQRELGSKHLAIVKKSYFCGKRPITASTSAGHTGALCVCCPGWSSKPILHLEWPAISSTCPQSGMNAWYPKRYSVKELCAKLYFLKVPKRKKNRDTFFF